MKHIFLSLALLIASILHGQVVMPAQTLAAIQVIRQATQQGRNAPDRATLDFFPIYPSSDGYRIAALARVTPTFDRSAAMRDGLEVGTIIGPIATLQVP